MTNASANGMNGNGTTGIEKQSDFESVVKARRSARKFLPGIEISDAELDRIFGLVKYAPSAFNLQHSHYLVVRDPETKDKVYEAANKQYKIKTASAVVVVFGRTDAHSDAAKIYEGMLHLGIFNKQQYEYEIATVQSFYEERGDAFKREEAIRNANLSAMLFMLAAKSNGWDTSPMIGFDPEKLMEAVGAPDRFVPALLIGIGKEDTSSQHIRGYRKPVGEFVSYDRIRD